MGIDINEDLISEANEWKQSVSLEDRVEFKVQDALLDHSWKDNVTLIYLYSVERFIKKLDPILSDLLKKYSGSSRVITYENHFLEGSQVCSFLVDQNDVFKLKVYMCNE